MKTIHRFELPITDCPTVDMPRGAVVLPTPPYSRNRECIEVWALVDSDAPLVPRGFRIVGTGNPMPKSHGPFIGTVVTHGGQRVWHIFDAVPVISLRNPDGTWQ